MKKKILFYLDSLNKGGLDKVVLDFVNHMDYDKYDVTVMRRFPGGYYTSLLNSQIKVVSNTFIDARKHPVYNHLIRVVCDRMPRKLMYRLFVHRKYDVEIACGDSWAATLIGGSTNKKSKKILWEHMDVTLDESTATHFSTSKVREFFSPFDKIIGVSKDCAQKFIEKYGFENKVTYIYNPIDIEDIEIKKEEEVESYDEGFNILAIGRFMPQKAFVRLIDVTKSLYEKGVKFNLNIIGEGPEESIIKNKIDEYGLKDKIKLLGFKENPYPYIKNADLLICSSIHESYCLVVAESLVVGTPVLSTACTGPLELLDNGKYGMIVENSNKGLQNGIETLVTDKNLLKKYKSTALERKDFFNVNTCIKQFEKIFEE